MTFSMACAATEARITSGTPNTPTTAAGGGATFGRAGRSGTGGSGTCGSGCASACDSGPFANGATGTATGLVWRGAMRGAAWCSGAAAGFSPCGTNQPGPAPCAKAGSGDRVMAARAAMRSEWNMVKIRTSCRSQSGKIWVWSYFFFTTGSAMSILIRPKRRLPGHTDTGANARCCIVDDRLRHAGGITHRSGTRQGTDIDKGTAGQPQIGRDRQREVQFGRLGPDEVTPDRIAGRIGLSPAPNADRRRRIRSRADCRHPGRTCR